jgi:hypothetical protein
MAMEADALGRLQPDFPDTDPLGLGQKAGSNMRIELVPSEFILECWGPV